jgi:HlyD family secretion protein
MRLSYRIGIFVALASAVTGIGLLNAKRLRHQDVQIPFARAQRGTVNVTAYAEGELLTPHSAMIVAPPIFGTLQIIHLAKSGTAVKPGDVIVQFDPAEQEYNLEQALSQLKEADQQITKARADAEVQVAQDKVALLKAKFDVRRAELEVQKNELAGEIDAKKNLLALEEAKRRLAQLEQDMRSRATSSDASITVLQQKRAQSQLQMQQAQHAIESMTIKAPIDGVVTIKQNMDASGGFFYPGVVLPEYREGDQANQGRTMAEIRDMKQLAVVAKISELDRPNVTNDATIELRFDVAPGRQYSAKVKSIAGLASNSQFWSASSTNSFDAAFEVTNPDELLRPGASAQVVIHGPSLQNSLYLPRQCLFNKDGKSLVYLRNRDGFLPKEIKILKQTESAIVVEGFSEGAEVALLDPTAQKTASRKAAAR